MANVALQKQVRELTNKVTALEREKTQSDCPTGMCFILRDIVYLRCYGSNGLFASGLSVTELFCMHAY